MSPRIMRTARAMSAVSVKSWLGVDKAAMRRANEDSAYGSSRMRASAGVSRPARMSRTVHSTSSYVISPRLAMRASRSGDSSYRYRPHSCAMVRLLLRTWSARSRSAEAMSPRLDIVHPPVVIADSVRLIHDRHES
jgi:hypothetical protein